MEKEIETTRAIAFRPWGFMGLGFRAAIAAGAGFQVSVGTA